MNFNECDANHHRSQFHPLLTPPLPQLSSSPSSQSSIQIIISFKAQLLFTMAATTENWKSSLTNFLQSNGEKLVKMFQSVLQKWGFNFELVLNEVEWGAALRKHYASSVNLLENDERRCINVLHLHNVSAIPHVRNEVIFLPGAFLWVSKRSVLLCPVTVHLYRTQSSRRPCSGVPGSHSSIFCSTCTDYSTESMRRMRYNMPMSMRSKDNMNTRCLIGLHLRRQWFYRAVILVCIWHDPSEKTIKKQINQFSM